MIKWIVDALVGAAAKWLTDVLLILAFTIAAGGPIIYLIWRFL